MDNTDVLKFRILAFMYEVDSEDCTVSNVSRTLQEEKYKVSRVLIRLEGEGLVDRSNPRAPILTEKGKNQAVWYMERVAIAQNHLLYEGDDMEHAKHDANLMAVYCSDELMNIMRDSDERYRVKHILKNKRSFSGDVLCQNMKDGSYPFPFIFYRERMKGNSNLSMANKGFVHPCILHVENGKGTIQLRILPMSEKSVKSGISMDGKVSEFAYFDNGRFVRAEFHGDTVSFPAGVLQFINMGEGVGQILHGSACIKMQCSVGIVHMPEAKALFTILI